MESMFDSCHNLLSLDLNTFDTTKVTSMEKMFYQCQKINEIKLSNKFKTDNVVKFTNMFSSCYDLKAINLDSFNTANADDMSLMFNDCRELTSIDLSNFITDKVKNFSHIFAGCEKLRDIDFNLNASSANDLSYLFFECRSLNNLNMTLLHTDQEINIDFMFYNCESLTNLIFGTNYYEINSMEYTFHGCTNLPNIDLTYFNVKNVVTMRNLFYGCKAITQLNLLSFNSNNCHIFDNMFGQCNDMNVTINEEFNKELIESAPEYVHFVGHMNIEMDFLYE
jgi:surface protein